MTSHGTAVIVNLGGGTVREYAEGAELLTEASLKLRSAGKRAVDMIELNISCPNIKEGGLAFGIENEQAREVVRAVRNATTLPLLVKLSRGEGFEGNGSDV